jgi:hypothetical protein
MQLPQTGHSRIAQHFVGLNVGLQDKATTFQNMTFGK